MTQEVEFSSVFEFIRNGMNVKQSKDPDGLPITRIETIADGIIDPQRVGYAGLDETECARWMLEPDDILFSHINSPEQVGKCARYCGLPERLVHGMNLLCFRPDPSKVNSPFMVYLLRTKSFRTKLEPFINKAVNQASVSIGNLKTIRIVIPPLATQKRVAAILDQVDEVRRKRRTAIELASRLPQAAFDQMFGERRTPRASWPVCTLADLVEDNDQINYGVVQPGAESESGIPLVRAANVVAGDFSEGSLKKIAPSIEALYKRSRLRGDEILIACVGSIGAVALATPELSGANIARAVARIRVDKKKAHRVFVSEFLRLDSTQRHFRTETRTVAQPTLNIKQLSETPIFLPPLHLQQEFASHIIEMEQLKIFQCAHLAKLDALFTSLQHRAFTGELTNENAERELAEVG